MSECFQRQSRKNFEFCSHKNCTLTITTDWPVEEERGEIEDELESPEEQEMRGGTLSEEEELPDLTPPAKASPDCPPDGVEDLHPNSTDLHPKRKGRKAVAAACKAVSDGPT